MNQVMVHRGPDSEGFLDTGPVALGMRRLKIIDLATGDQPIFSEDRRVAIVMNGEVYNYRELRGKLQALGHRFATRSDTEVIVHAYEEWGIDCLHCLRGMFAFALCDQRDQSEEGRGSRLFLARDRLGIKPMYLWYDGQCLLFASEVRALLASRCVRRELSLAGLYTYLGFGSVQEPLTLVPGVFSLTPGTWMEAQAGRHGLELRSGTYWELTGESSTDPEPERVRQWLADAVASHLVSDVPLGAFLSGGLDSGAIVALGSQALGAPLCTFTLAFDQGPGDERVRALSTARRWSSEHHVRVISQNEVLGDLSGAIHDMDQPTMDGINTWYISREARRSGLTVALSGVGGDELFAGYPSFRRVPNLKRLQRALKWLPNGPWLEDAVSSLPKVGFKLTRVAALLAGEMFFNHAYFATRGLFGPRQVLALLSESAVEQLGVDGAALELWQDYVWKQIQLAEKYHSVEEVSWLELNQYMRSTLLRDSDALSMAHSLEVRVPFVDHLLVERILSVRGSRKIDRQQPKPLLVNALATLLPPDVATGEKRTFTLPFEHWLRQDLAPVVRSALHSLPEGLVRWLDPVAVQRVWKEFERGSTNWSRPWMLFVLAEWVKYNL